MTLTHINPESLHQNPAFSQGVLVEGPGVAPADMSAGFAAAQDVWGGHPTALTVLQVVALARPDCLVEIEALAHVPGASVRS